MDVIKTRNYYKTINNDSLCSCDYCKNYRKEIQKTYPALSDFLSDIGIDIEKPFETMPLEPDKGILFDIRWTMISRQPTGSKCTQFASCVGLEHTIHHNPRKSSLNTRFNR